MKNLFSEIKVVSDIKFLEKADIEVFFVSIDDIANLEVPYNNLLKKLADNDEKMCKCGQVTNFIYDGEMGLKRVVVVGLGNKKEITPDILRNTAGEAARVIKELPGKNKKIMVCAALVNSAVDHCYVKALVEGLILGSYEFEEYKSKIDEQFNNTVGIYTKNSEIKKVIGEAKILCDSIIWTRNLINKPGNIVQPQYIADEALKLADELGISCEVLNIEDMDKMGMNALLAVGKGSAAEPKLVTVKYQGSDNAKWVALVGKGITFDSGGISIKPEAGMGEMKDDMAGAAAALGAIRTIAKLKLPCNVMAIAACAENMPSGNALRPGDIVKAANGKTIEVVSTDAEGRMVLADAVWYACRQGASNIVDIATLTGAVIIALGNETAAIIGNNDELCDKLLKAGKDAGEKYWRLPSLPECKDAIKSDVADLLNSAGRAGGVITGGLFIGEFVDDNIPWAHIDIGGTSTTQKTKGYWVKGATGVGVATLVQLMKGF